MHKSTSKGPSIDCRSSERKSSISASMGGKSGNFYDKKIGKESVSATKAKVKESPGAD